MSNRKLIGPFTQLITLEGLPEKGAIPDRMLSILPMGGVIVSGDRIDRIGSFDDLEYEIKDSGGSIERIGKNLVAMPGFVDPHTHLCFAGTRAQDYSERLSGKSYLEISQSGGGIVRTVKATREATADNLIRDLHDRTTMHLQNGVTTMEVKSGYCLDVEGELKMLQVIDKVNQESVADLIPTCLAAHMTPQEYNGNPKSWIKLILSEILPRIKGLALSKRVDIFVEQGAFSVHDAHYYLSEARKMGFDLVVHGNQFSVGGVGLACDMEAVSVDHLEAITPKEIDQLARSKVIAVALPGASLGLGERFAPARKLLDAGCCLAIGSDWNPGSAPMGDLLTQTALLGIYERMTMAESFAAITFRGAKALRCNDRGILKNGYLADIVAFPTDDYREILYHQGQMRPVEVWERGRRFQRQTENVDPEI